MNTKISLPLVLASGALLLGCGDGYKTTDNGLKYKILHDEDGENAKTGDILTVHMTFKSPGDSVLYSSYETGQPAVYPLSESPFKGSLEEGLTLLSPGDSARFLVSADSLFGKLFKEPLPEFVKEGDFMIFEVKLLKAENETAFRKSMDEKAEEQKVAEDKIIKDYLAEKGLQAEKTPTGLYYSVTTPGSGANPVQGDTVSVHYTGKLLDGTVFDSSEKSGEPIKFPLGMRFVIPGWDQGISLINKGSKATLYIPSHLAYGTAGAGNGAIPGNAVLIFDVELVDIKK